MVTRPFTVVVSLAHLMFIQVLQGHHYLSLLMFGLSHRPDKGVGRKKTQATVLRKQVIGFSKILAGVYSEGELG